MALVPGPVPEVGAGRGPRVGGSDRAEDSSESSLEPQAPDYHVPRQGGRGGSPDVRAPPHLSAAKPLGIYLSLCPGVHACACVSTAGCVSVPVFVSVCICAFVSVCGCWSTPVCVRVSAGHCVSLPLCMSKQ